MYHRFARARMNGFNFAPLWNQVDTFVSRNGSILKIELQPKEERGERLWAEKLSVLSTKPAPNCQGRRLPSRLRLRPRRHALISNLPEDFYALYGAVRVLKLLLNLAHSLCSLRASNPHGNENVATSEQVMFSFGQVERSGRSWKAWEDKVTGKGNREVDAAVVDE